MTVTSHSKEHALAEIVTAMYEQNKVLGIARNDYLAKEAERKHFESTLIDNAEGKSVNAREIKAQASQEWLEFSKELARLKAIYEFQDFKFQVMDKEFQALYLEAKLNAPLIRKGGAA